MYWWAWDNNDKNSNRENYSREVQPAISSESLCIRLDDTPDQVSRAFYIDDRGEMWIYDPLDEPDVKVWFFY